MKPPAARIGIDIYKVGMVWPLALHDAMDFVQGKREILVVEEKRGIIESQFKEYFYDYPGAKPERMVGKHDENGARLIPWTGELSPRAAGADLARRLDAMFPGLDLAARAAALLPEAERTIEVPGATRTPYFCSGCPHNTSTKVPEGSQGAGRHRLPFHGELDGPGDVVADPDGRRRRELGRIVAVHRPQARLPESRRRHLLSFRLDGDPPGHRGQGKHHLQDPVQRRRRHDRRPAGRRPRQRACDRAQRPRRRRRAHRAGLG